MIPQIPRHLSCALFEPPSSTVSFQAGLVRSSTMIRTNAARPLLRLMLSRRDLSGGVEVFGAFETSRSAL
jgi:hypothetical protein